MNKEEAWAEYRGDMKGFPISIESAFKAGWDARKRATMLWTPGKPVRNPDGSMADDLGPRNLPHDMD